jgi:outer membrane protein insertion porin family
MFPLTADDMIRGVTFCSDNFRLAPGIGIRINIPALGPAPLAFDLAVPILHADGDNLQNFSFFFGFGR